MKYIPNRLDSKASFLDLKIRNLAVFTISGYQKFISPHKGFSCADLSCPDLNCGDANCLSGLDCGTLDCSGSDCGSCG